MYPASLSLYLSTPTLVTAKICSLSSATISCSDSDQCPSPNSQLANTVPLADYCATSNSANIEDRETIPNLYESKLRMSKGQSELSPSIGCELPRVVRASDETAAERSPCINIWDAGATLNVDMKETYESIPGEAGGPPSEATIRKELKARGYEEKHVDETVARLHVQEIWG